MERQRAILFIFLIATLSTPDDTEDSYQKLLSNAVDLVYCSMLALHATMSTVITPSSPLLLGLLTAYMTALHISRDTVNQTCSAMLLIQNASSLPSVPPPLPSLPLASPALNTHCPQLPHSNSEPSHENLFLLPQELAEVQQEGASVVELLQQRQAGLAATLGQQFPEMRNTTWQSESSVQAAAQTLTPQMTENKKKVTI